MGYAKKKFDGEFLRYFNIISSHGQTSVSEVNSYQPTGKNVRALYWEGNCKEEICNNVDKVDSACSDVIYREAVYLVNKTKIVFGVLYPDLKMLKDTIDLYNTTIDEIASVESQIAAERQRLSLEGDVT